MATGGNTVWTLDDLRREFERYSDLVNAADLAPTTKTTYLIHADRFVRLLAGEVDIGSGFTGTDDGSPGGPLRGVVAQCPLRQMRAMPARDGRSRGKVLVMARKLVIDLPDGGRPVLKVRAARARIPAP